MSNKWRVTIHQSNRNGSSSPKCRWVVDPPGYNHKNRNWGDYRWHVAGGKWFAWGSKTSKREAWEQAIAYADRRARTREYVLPRQPLPLTLPGVEDEDALIYVTNGKNGCVYLKDEDHSETLTLYARELRPLALALLAHTERISK
ncbi:hypothetical protein [Corynebacterium simulans]|uniref:hypothetical protein n=1 Tax=Corynebacterium simulans TaxID=146827 RepID=UPI00078179D3|nr:hypothetical protein [Corynebacterium simulans]